MSESISITDSEQAWQDLSSSPEWQNLISHFEMAEGFAFIVLIVPDADGVDACSYVLESYLKSRDQNLKALQFAHPDEVRNIAQTLLDLEPPPRTGAIWVSATSPNKNEDEGQWLTAWREGCASLNKFRNHLRDKFNVPLLFAGPEWLQVTLREMSPDLWSVRTLVVHIESVELLLSALIENARVTGAVGLSLAGKGLKQLPESIRQLSQLQYLDLSGNKLSEMPESITQLFHLQTLDLDDNQLSELPESIGQLSRLESLYLDGNKLSELPESIGQLSQLQQLHLNGNRLSELPESIGQLSQLQELSLEGNRLIMLPDSIGQLPCLQQLYLSDNYLSTLPESLRNLHSLEMLFLHGNDSLGLPKELLGPTWREVAARKSKRANPPDILEYYFRTREGSRPLNEAKLILVGRGAVGKTSIVNRLVHDRFDEREKKTDGIKIIEWPIRLNTKEDVRLNIWDFGGQEIMHATHQFFLTPRSLYLLVLNGREGGEDADAEYWLRLIESFGDESPVIVVMNKIKEYPFDLNRRALQQKFPAIREFIKTDCLDGTGIKDLRRSIERETDRLDHLRDSFPASWFSIKDRLAGMKKNFLSFDEYRKESAKLGEKEESAQESLAGYLHNLGIVLNYKDDPRLRDTHILNPHWVTNGIYKIINSNKLEKQKGEIRLEDIAAILDRREYPPGMHSFIIDLMKKFDLCFSFPDDEHHYLIPELLDKQQPEEADEFRPEECLNFQYHYPVLPEGLLPRFIVRTHVLSEGLQRWRTGVILKFDGCRALVKADVQDRKVFVTISGPVSNRRRLLAVIRSDFERIHRDIRSLKVQGMVPLPESPDVLIPYDELLAMERSGIGKFPKVIGGRVIELDVQELLNGVDLDGVRREDRGKQKRSGAVRLFYSYSHRDEHLRNELETHLKMMQRQGLIDMWHDRRIIAGEEWKDKIDENLERADIILLLVSADFIASNYCWDIEINRALERHASGEARVIPVIIRDVNWHSAPFAKLQALPKDGLPVTRWPDRDAAWLNVSEGIERAVKDMRRRP